MKGVDVIAVNSLASNPDDDRIEDESNIKDRD